MSHWYARVLEADGYGVIILVVMVWHEQRLECIKGIHFNLVIPRVGVHKAQCLTWESINQDIDIWNMIRILGTSCIKISEINAHVPLVWFLFHQDNVGYPGWVFYLSNENGNDNGKCDPCQFYWSLTMGYIVLAKSTYVW